MGFPQTYLGWEEKVRLGTKEQMWSLHGFVTCPEQGR